nr:Cytochrome P450 [Sitophilus oryzae]
MFIEIIFVAVICAIAYMKWINTYWKRRGLIQIEPDLFFGNVRKTIFGDTSLSTSVLQRYNTFKVANSKHGGIYIFTNPVYMPIDPAIIKNIMLRDFSHFVNRGSYHTPEDILSMNLVNMENEAWKNLRAKLTPTFTSGKMKMMFETLVEKTGGLEKAFGEYADSLEPCAVKDVLGRFTTDVIGSCGFGIECNSLEDPENIFRKVGKRVIEPKLSKFIFTSLFPWRLLGKLKYKRSGNAVANFFINLVQDTIKHRESNRIYRKDFMQLLLELKNTGTVSDNSEYISQKSTRVTKQGISVNEIIAQCFIFFVAGFETSSTAMTFALLELAQNQDIQNKLRKEIEDVLLVHDGKVTYEAVMEMKYLDMVVNEAMRKYPPVPVISRMCNRRYEVPGTDVVIEKGIRVHFPVYGLHRDPDYYPNPEVFNPENFSEENKAKRPEFTFLPFGEGPRMCIGLRFGLLQAKVGLISVIRNFNFTLSKRTQFPLKMEKN